MTQRTDRAGVLVRSKWNADLSASSLLVGFRPAQVNDDSVRCERHIRDVDGRELRPSEGSGKAHENESAVSGPEEAVRAVFDNPADVGG
jgi:hypothetical protein